MRAYQAEASVTLSTPGGSPLAPIEYHVVSGQDQQSRTVREASAPGKRSARLKDS